MKIDELKKILKENKAEEIVYKGKCHDCSKDVEVLIQTDGNKITVSGGALYKVDPPSINPLNTFFKCDKCFKKDKVLRNFRKTEVYSRIVGYLRPVDNWNMGKKEEFKKRKNFNV